MGTLAEFQNSALQASANKWKVLLDPLDGGQLGTADAKTIVVKASNLVYVSGPPDTGRNLVDITARGCGDRSAA